MKGPIAAVTTGIEAFLAGRTEPPAFRLFVLIAGDEEALRNVGTLSLLDDIEARGLSLDYGLVAEPTSQKELGDTIKIGRRGSLHGFLKVYGKQGHSAYPQLARNPISRSASLLDRLDKMDWGKGTAGFPATTLQFTRVHSDAGASNVIPGLLDARFNIRFSPDLSVQEIERKVEAVVARCDDRAALEWSCDAQPFLTKPGLLTEVVAGVLSRQTGRRPSLATGGGTSDARYLAARGVEVIEFGPVGETCHQPNEHVRVRDLDISSRIYRGILEGLLAATARRPLMRPGTKPSRSDG